MLATTALIPAGTGRTIDIVCQTRPFDTNYIIVRVTLAAASVNCAVARQAPPTSPVMTVVPVVASFPQGCFRPAVPGFPRKPHAHSPPIDLQPYSASLIASPAATRHLGNSMASKKKQGPQDTRTDCRPTSDIARHETNGLTTEAGKPER